MIFKILPVCLLTFSCALPKSNVNEISRSNEEVTQVQPRKKQVRNALQYSTNVYGLYNFRDSYDWNEVNNIADGNYTINLDGVNDNDVYNYIVPISFQYDLESHQQLNNNKYYLSSIRFNVSAENQEVYIYLGVYYKNENSGSGDYEINVHDYLDYGDSISNWGRDFQSLFFYVRNQYNLDGNALKLFNIFFTHEDNTYVTSYNGYYNFNNGLTTFSYYFDIYGTTVFSNNITYGITNRGSDSNDVLYAYRTDVLTNQFTVIGYSLPFNTELIVPSNILLTNAKIRLTDYANLNSMGAFSYIPTVNDADLDDLLLTIADVPVYFITQLLNFDLFGFNLFVACASLVTLLVVIFVVRKLF